MTESFPTDTELRVELPAALTPVHLRAMLDAGLRVWAADAHTWLGHRLAPRLGQDWEDEISEDGHALDAAAVAKLLAQPRGALQGLVKGNQAASAREVKSFRNALYHSPVNPRPEEELHVGTARRHLRTLHNAATAFGFSSVLTFRDLLAHVRRLEERPVLVATPPAGDPERTVRERDEALARLELTEEQLLREQESSKAAQADQERQIALLEAEKGDNRQQLALLATASERLQQEIAERDAQVQALAEDVVFVHRQLAAAQAARPADEGFAGAATVCATGRPERWRLSPSRRSMTRVEDEADLGELVGTARAVDLVGQFLQRRPEGGRVWVDTNGEATTLVAGRLVTLGSLANREPTSLPEAITRELQAAPGSTAREVLHALRGTVWRSDKRTVNSCLYSGEGSAFRKDDSSRPRWFTLAQDASKTTPRERVQRAAREVVALQELSSDLPTPGPVPVHPAQVPVPAPNSWGLTLHTWQVDALHAWHDAGCHGVVEAVTGSGKTHVGLAAARRAAQEGLPTTVLVPSIDLQRQWARRFAEHLPELRVATIGGRRSGNVETADVVVAVVHSALRTDLVRGRHGDLLIADEVHRYGANTWAVALRAGYTRRLGLTATLERGDDAVDAVIRPYFGGSVARYSFAQARRDEVVAPFHLLLLPVQLNGDEQEVYDRESRRLSDAVGRLRGAGALAGGSQASLSQRLRTLAGAGGQIGRAAQTAEAAIRQRRSLLAGVDGKLDAIEELAELVSGSQGTVVFTQTRDTSEEVAHRLRSLGVPAAALHADMDDRERAGNLDALEGGALSALTAPKLLDEGIDIPSVDLGIVTSASRSTRQMVQRLGRVIRRKTDGRAIDFVILFAAGTIEDPADGAHDGFFEVVTDAAASTRRLDLGWTAADLGSREQ